MADDEKKIIVDEDWKKEAKQEKEKLVKETTETKEKSNDQKMPPGDFAAVISMMATQALFAMGMLQVEGQEDRKIDLNIAKYNIDMLETIQEKTKGNLAKDEEKILSNTISQLQSAYVQKASEK